MQVNVLIHRSLALLPALVLTCAAATEPAAQRIFLTYVILGDNGTAHARAVTSDGRCPQITIDDRGPAAMDLRNAAGRVKSRSSVQSASKDADFPVSVCEYLLPAGVAKVSVAGTSLPVPRAQPRRILLIGDSGCRMKASAEEFQDCNDEASWPFETISKRAAAWRPDLVVHLGDFHYRESPCPPANTGCAGSPWGYGFDVWDADFFRPARALLEVAPWVAVRGNHESCRRAGQGWFRFLDPAPFESRRSCDDPAHDGEGDFSAPYAVPISADTQLIVFDSSKAAGEAYTLKDQAYARYAAQLRQVDDLSHGKARNIFLSHHPVLGFASSQKSRAVPGNPALQSVMRLQYPQRLFPAAIDLALHGHVHLFEAISFKSAHPPVLVSGNAGSSLALPLPARLSVDDQPVPGAVVDEFFSHAGFGFLTMERSGDGWKFTAWDSAGKPLTDCQLRAGKMHCAAAPSTMVK